MIPSKGNGLAAMAALALGAASLGLPSSVKAGSPLNNINHIVVIYQENWTFDALYGSFPGANGLSNASATSMAQLDKLNSTLTSGTITQSGTTTGGYTGATLISELPSNFVLSNTATYGAYNDQSYNGLVTTNPPKPVNDASTITLDPSFEVSGTSSALLINTLYPYSLTDPALSPLSNAGDNYNAYNYITGDIYHRYWQEQFQINGGAMNMFQSWCDDPGLTLSHYNATDLPEGILAQQYTLCDNYFHSAFGGSFLNHQFLIACQAPVYTATPPGSILSAVDPTSGVLELAGLGNNISLTGLTTSGGSKTVTCASTVGLYKNMVVADSGGVIPAGDTITGINSETSFTVNVAATASESSVTGTATPGIPSGDDVGELANDSKVTPIGAPSFESYLNGDVPTQTYGQHYAVNTIYTNNLVPVGTATGAGSSVMPSVNDSHPANPNYEQNIGDLLGRAGITWKWYSGGWNEALSASPSNPAQTTSTAAFNTWNAIYNFQWHHQCFAYFDNYAPFGATVVDPTVSSSDPYLLSASVSGSTSSAAHLQDETNFLSDVSNNTLPQVCFIKPVGLNNEHPGYAALQVGMAHVQSLIQAVQANPSLWAHTMIIITYDEHGGRWDHVAPPHRDIWGPGSRVPCLVISPYAKQSYIDHTQYDTSSILATIEARFLTQSGSTTTLNSLDANAPTFINTLTNIQITQGPFTYNRRAGTYTQTVTITNLDTNLNTGSSIAGPLYLALNNLSSNTTLENATGTVGSSPYITAVASAGGIAPGASATVSLVFTAPSTGSITYSPGVASGTP
jgi:acid phosphatase